MRHRPWLFLLLAMGLWLGLVGRVTAADALLGLPVILSAWWLYHRVSDPLAHGISPSLPTVGRYMLLYVAPEVLRSTYRVFRKVLTPDLGLSPAIVKVEVPQATQTSLILLAYGISLTPGQQIIAIDEQTRTMYVHALDAPDPDAVSEEIAAVHRRFFEPIHKEAS